jgi:phage gp46-like protein
VTDLALSWIPERFGADLSLTGADLTVDDGLKTAVIISLFTDARAAADDTLPAPGADPRGWWGDVEPEVAGDSIGSRLWELAREKIVPRTLARAKEYAEEALAWLVTDKIAKSVEVVVEAQPPATLALGVIISRPDGRQGRFDFVWSNV